MEQPFSLPQHPEQEGMAEIRRQRVKCSLKDVGASMPARLQKMSNFLKQPVPRHIWDSVGG